MKDLDQVDAFWATREPKLAPTVLETIGRRILWLADAPFHLGTPAAGLPADHRYYLERRYGYKIYYRIVGNPPEALPVLRIRNARQRRLRSSEIE